MTAAGRALWRLAWRGVRAAPLRHGLIVAAIACAVAIAVAVSIVLRANTLVDEQRRAGEYGQAQLVLEQSSFGVAYDDLPAVNRAEVDELLGGPRPGVTVADVEQVLADRLPPDAQLARERRLYSGVAGGVAVVAADPTDPVLSGRFGASPPALAPGEALVPNDVLRRLDAEVGDVIDLDPIGEVTVVGRTVHLRWTLPQVVVAADTVLPARAQQTWSVAGLSPGTVESLAARLEQDLQPADDLDPFLTESHVQFQIPGVDTFAGGDEQRPEVIAALVGAVLLVQVGFVAAAAFATGLRRRIREHGLLAASVGAEPRHLGGLVRREALVLGVIGASLGVALGVLGTWLGSPLVDRFFVPLGGRLVPAPADLAPAVLGVVAAAAAGWSPARTARRVPPMVALAGRVPLRAVRRWVAPVSLTAVAIGAVGLFVALRATASGAWVAQTVSRSTSYLPGGMSDVIDLRTVRNVAIVGSVAVLYLGVAGLAGPLLAQLGRLAGRGPLPLRLALRDSVRQRTRSAATIAATTVVLTAPVLIVTLTASNDATVDSAVAEVEADDVAVISGPDYAGRRLSPAPDDLERARAALPPIDREISVESLGGAADDGQVSVSSTREPPFESWFDTGLLSDDVATFLGIEPRPGTAVLVAPLGLIHVGRDGEITEDVGGPVQLRPADLPSGEGSGPAPDLRTAGATDAELVVADRALPFRVPGLLLSPDLADDLGLTVTTSQVLAELSRPVTLAEAESLYATFEATTVDVVVAIASTESQDAPWPLLSVLAGGIVALVIALLAGALAATETDRDLTTMAAVGADPRTRPRVRGLQAGVHAAMAVALAVPAGLLLAAVAIAGSGFPPRTVVPWPLLALLAIATPLIVALPIRWLSRPGRADAGAPGLVGSTGLAPSPRSERVREPV